MFRVYNCIVTQHDLPALAIAVLICLFGATISYTTGQRAILEDAVHRKRRLLLAGLLTGLTIWATHFTAMLGYTPGVEVRIDVLTAALSAVFAIIIAACGWLILSKAGRWRGGLGGGLFGLALAVAHFMDMSAMRVSGIVIYDHTLIISALLLGLPLCILSGIVSQHVKTSSLAWRPAILLVLGILTLHFVAMSAVRIIPVTGTAFGPLDLGVREFTFLVAAAAAVILVIAIGMTLHDLEVARLTAIDRERLRKSEEHHRYSVELNPQIPWIADAAGRVLEISPRWVDFVGTPVSSAAGTGWTRNVHPDDIAHVLEIWSNAISSPGGVDADVRYRLRGADGSYRWFRARARPRLDAEGEVVMWYGNLEDIDDQVNAEEALRASEERYRLASLATNDVIWDLKVGSERIEWSGAVETVLGYTKARFGTSREWWLEQLHPDEREAVAGHLEAVTRSSAESWEQEFRFRRSDGQYANLLTRGLIVRDPAGRPLRMVGSLMDISARKQGEDELRWAAHHDPLTGLPNRKLFSLRLDDALIDADRSSAGAGLVVIDVDRFKTLNDTLGHVAGDAMLREIAKRLTNSAPPGATVARLGGDEFAIVIPRLTDAAARRETLDNILRGTDAPFSYDGRQIEVSLSIGAARYPGDATDSEALLKSADLALYAAKADGLGKARGFDPTMRAAAETEKRMLSDARNALSEHQIVPFYQPQVCLRSGRILGFEALLRWHDHDRGIQPPASLLAAFHDPKLAPEITSRMLAQTIANMQKWLDEGYDFGRVAINGSTEDFRRGDLADRILESLAQAGVAPSRFELEVTETVLLGKHVNQVETSLRTLRAAGVAVALDDFGTGYASLTHLKQFEVDTLKIDRSFISRLASEAQQDAIIVGALIDLAKNLGISTVAEGVETELQAFMLRRRGCDAAQGYLFERPLPAMRIPSFLKQWQPQTVLADFRFAASGSADGLPAMPGSQEADKPR